MNIWVPFHVASVWIGFGSFILASAGAAFYIFSARRLKLHQPAGIPTPLPSLESIDRFNYGVVMVGFIFLTIGILLGGNLVKVLGGMFFHSGAKVTTTWATWSMFGLYLILRSLWKWKSMQSNYLIIAGFVLIVLSWGIFR